MSIGVIIFVILCFIAGMMSRTKSTITRNNDNAHLFNNDDGFIQDKTINRKDLIKEIEEYYKNGQYQKVKFKSEKYIKYYNQSVYINYLLVFSLIQLRDIQSAEHYASNVLYQLNNDKTGNFLLGYVKFAKNDITSSLDYLERALNYGLKKEAILDVIHDNEFLNELFDDIDKDKLPF